MQEQVRLTTQEAFLYGMLFTAAVGFAVGLVPLVFGIWKKKVGLGFLGLIASTIGGAILGLLLAIPAAAVFIWRIMKVSKTDSAANDSSTTDNL